jgi:hypothetical protein
MKQKSKDSGLIRQTGSLKIPSEHSAGCRRKWTRYRLSGRYLLFYLISALTLLVVNNVKAQQIGAGTGAPSLDFEVANGPRQFTVTVFGGIVSSGSLTISLPTGYVYIGGSAVASGGLVITENSFSGNTATLSISGIPVTGTNATFTYDARATCAAIGVASNQASYVFTPTGGSAQPEKLSNSFNLKNAKINITNLANTPATAGVVGDNYVRTYRINNNGFGNIDTVYVSDVSGNGVTHLGQSVSTTSTGETVTVSLVSSTVSGSNTTYLYRFIISNTAQDNHLGQNEYFTFTQNLQIASCTNTNTSLNAFYGVGPTNVQPCTGQNDTQTTALAVDNSKQPVLTITPVTTTFPKCRGIAVTQEFKVANTGTAPAKDILLRLFHYNGQASSLPGNATGFPKNNQMGYVPGTFKYKIGVSGTYTTVPLAASSGVTLTNQVNYTTASCLNTTAPDRLDLLIPDLLVGQEIYFLYDEINCCYTECLPALAPTSAIRNSYKNACGVEIGNTLTSGNAVTLRAVTQEQIDIKENFPTDMIPGQSYVFKFETVLLLQSGSIYTAGSTYRYQVTLPAGLVYGAPNTIKLRTASGVDITPTSVIQTGQVLDISFTTTGAGFPLSKAVLSIENIALDCASAAGSNGIVNTKMFFRSAGCTTCEQQVYCEDNSVALHCPGPCPDPAMVVSNFTILRTNYGQPDNNNDGAPDGATLSSNVRNNWVTRGDNLAFTFYGTVKDDGATPVNFKFGYAKFTFPSSIGSNFTAVTADVVITDATGTVTKVNKTGMAFTFVPGGATGTVDFSIAQLATAGYSEFVNGDKVTITANLKVTNGMPGQLVSAPVTTDFYLSNAANPAGTTGDKWSCGNFSGAFTLLGMQHYLSAQNAIGNECNTLTSNGAMGFIVGQNINNGGPGVNFFTDEFRQFAVANNLYYTVPSGYTLEQFTIFYRYGTAGYNSVILSTIPAAPDAINGSEYRYNVRKYFADQPGGTWPLPDEGFYVTFSAVLRPTCAAAAISTDAYRLEIVPSPTYLETLPPGSAGTSQFTPGASNVLTLTKSNIVVNAATPIVTTTGNTVTWEVQVANTQPGTSPKIWMGENTTPTNGITIQSVQQITAYGGTTVGSPIALTGDMYQLGTYGQESRYYRVTATFTNCGQDVVPLAVGYVCGTYPTSIDAAACKNITNLTVIPTDADLQVSLVSQPTAGTHDLCEELEYAAEVKNPAQGTAYNLTFTVNKPAGVAYIANSFALSPTLLPTSATFTAVNNDAAYVSETATTLTFTIPASVIANLPYNQGYTIKYRVNTVACDFVSGTKMKVLANGKNGCGSAINGTQQQTQTVRIKGENANPNSYTITSSVSAPVNACSPADLTYTFAAKNEGPVPTYAGETIRVVIPKPYTLGLVTGISNFTSGTAPTVTSSATTTTYVWTLPVGIAVNQNISFSAPLTASASDIGNLSCGTLPILEQVNYTFESTCLASGVTCLGSLQAEGENTGTGIVINKPALNITGFTAATPTAGNVVEGTVTISNTNGITDGLPQAATITIYHDSNNNGIADASDVQIGTKAITVSTSSPQVFNYSFTTTYSGNLCPVLVVLNLGCACENPVVYAYSCTTPLPVTLQIFELREAEKGVLLSWVTTTEANSDRFEIQHSVDAKNWSDIGTVTASGESKLTSKYSFIDADAVNGLNYYRLKMVDKDNTYSFSRINSIILDGGLGIIYPNPVNESITLGIDNTKTISSLEIFDTKGTRVLKTTKLVSNKINVERLIPGIYLLKITQISGAVIVQKIVKQ